MRARCERHGLALGPSGCLLCRREQGASAAAEAAAQTAVNAASAAGAEAVPAPAPVAASAVAAAPVAAAPAEGTPVATPLPDPPHAAPALVTDFPPPRQLSIQIPRSVLLLPLAGLGLYLLVAFLPKAPPTVDAAAVQAKIAVSGKEAAAAAQEPAAAPEDAPDDAPAAAQPDLSPTDIARLRERTRQAQQLADARERVKVTLFYTERCPHCSEARGYLTAHGVRAEQYDIDKDPKARARYLRLNPKGSLPTIVVEKQVLAGFDGGRLEQAIDRAAHARLAPAPRRRRR